MKIHKVLAIMAFAVLTKTAKATEKEESNFKRIYTEIGDKPATTDTLKIGDLCPDFNMENLDRKEAKLSDLRGKYVLIDVWASWCYPCRQQFPHLEKLMEELNSDEIVFLGVNLDVRDFKWIGDVNNLHLKGEQWRVLDTEFKERFGISYIPRYILLDKEGYVLETFMTRPDKPETKVYLEKLLNKK